MSASTEIRDQITEIIATGSVQERKSMCEALLAELHIDGGVAMPVIRIPLSRDDTPLIPQAEARTAENAVRARPPSVELRLRHKNQKIMATGPELELPLARERQFVALQSQHVDLCRVAHQNGKRSPMIVDVSAVR